MRWTRSGALLFVAAAFFMATPSGDTSSRASSYVPPFRFVEIGRVLGPSDIGAAPGPTTGTSDVSAVALPDGRVRLYFLYSDGTDAKNPVRGASAISSDGTHFTVEPGLEKTATLVFTLPDGRYRLFYVGCVKPVGRGCDLGVFSETSSDGLNFTADSGVRLNPFSQYGAPICSAIVKLSDGRYRIYCSEPVQPFVCAECPQASGADAIFSAVSSDLLTWTPDPGIRIGPGARWLTERANHPTALVNSDGTVTLVYDRNPPGPIEEEMIATSKDGLDFRAEADTGIVGTEPSFARLSDGSLLLYHGEQSAATGSLINVARVIANPVLTVTVHGEGYVRSSPDGISCPAACSETLSNGFSVTLRALPAEAHMLASWSGGCTGHRSCSLRMTADKSVTARFVAIPRCKKGQKPTQRNRCRR